MTKELFSVSDKIVVLTGGLGQLGRAYAVALAERGAKVATLDLQELDAEREPELLPFHERGSLMHIAVDITRKTDLEDALETIRERWGTPDVLVNNAALDSPPGAPPEEVGPFETYPEASFDQVMGVNVNGSVFCCQVFGGAMAKAGSGSIINISSIYGMLSPCQDIYDFRRKEGETFFKPVAYSVSKSAVLNLTRYLATYWAKAGVRVNTLTLAGVFNHQPEPFLKEYCKRNPMGRMADPEDYIGPLVYLASPASRYMTGSNLVVDGGWSAW